MDSLELKSIGDENGKELNFTADVMEKIALLKGHCWSWDTNKAEYHRAVYASDENRKTSYEEELEEWEFQDTLENRARVDQQWRTDYIEWMVIYGDGLFEMGQGDYIVQGNLEDLELEEIAVLGYSEKCTHRIKFNERFKWIDDEKQTRDYQMDPRNA
jgi:hypothetical protein